MASLEDSGKTHREPDPMLERKEEIRSLLRLRLGIELGVEGIRMSDNEKQKLKNYRSQFPEIYYEIHHEIRNEIRHEICRRIDEKVSKGFNQ